LVESDALGHDLLFILGLQLGVWVLVLRLERIHYRGEAITQRWVRLRISGSREGALGPLNSVCVFPLSLGYGQRGDSGGRRCSQGLLEDGELRMQGREKRGIWEFEHGKLGVRKGSIWNVCQRLLGAIHSCKSL
jgi:hypothetical protein